ncbi:PD-(D/E)XK nuclease family protein [Vaginisenegalia massiliensis]|uniref:PD-(D/E)XK nuclease family protein n=1 Tax=Vaginisenegalia massiliensis TaxID=2058294 RepID=UPI000F535535|nr:PD-(D/E)XK nuclease family protein [Vaginisenegalia massiliensis]
MAIGIIKGDPRLDKKKALVQEIIQLKQKDNQAKIFYLVPDHLKFDMEKKMLNELKRATGSSQAVMLDIQVVSFKRLSWFLAKGQSVSTSLSSVGIAMLIRHLLNEHQERLTIYRRQVNHQGFVDKLVSLFDELYQGQIEASDLIAQDRFDRWLKMDCSDLEGDEDGTTRLTSEEKRLSELAYLYDAFYQRLQAENIQFHGYLEELKESIDKAQDSDLAHSYLYIDHYDYFSAQELSLILDLAAKFKQVWVILSLNESHLSKQTWPGPFDHLAQTRIRIQSLAKQLNIDWLAEREVGQVFPEYHPSILSLADDFLSQSRGESVKKGRNKTSTIHEFWECDSIQTELQMVANTIHQLISFQGYRYQDILIMTRNLDRYRQIVDPIFKQNHIPFFYDHQTKMQNHPFVVWLQSLFNLKQFGFQYQDLMMVIKSPLFLPARLRHLKGQAFECAIAEHQYQIHLLENLVLAEGYTLYRFSDENYIWHFYGEDLPYINLQGQVQTKTQGQVMADLRAWINQEIQSIFSTWTKDQSGTQASQWLYQALLDGGIKDRLVQERDRAIEQSQLDLSRQYEQVWQATMTCLEEFQLIFKDSPVEFSLFSELVMTGLCQASFHIIPPTLDQVTFTNIESPQVGPYKVAFIVGLSDDLLPIKRLDNSLLSRENRQAIEEGLLAYQYLSLANQVHLNQEMYYFYQVLLAASDRLYCSFASQVDGAMLRWSPYVQNLLKGNQFTIKHYQSNLSLSPTLDLEGAYFGAYSVQLAFVIKLWRLYFEAQKQPDSAFMAWLNTLLINQDNRDYLRRLMTASLCGQDMPTYIEADLAKELYGTHLSVSVSRMEEYFRDPFSHFLTYGLRIKEREIQRLDANKVGTYFHDALDFLVKAMTQEGQSFSNISPERLNDLWIESQKVLAEQGKFDLFSQTPRYQLINETILRRLWQFLYLARHQSDYLQIQTLKTEALFGYVGVKQSLQGLSYLLPSGAQVSIRGKIDRLDLLRSFTNHQDYLQVIDYKTGKKQFNLQDFYYGLDLQILTYLRVAQLNYLNLPVFGAFYQPVITPYVSSQDSDDLRESDHFAQESYLLENRVSGPLFVNKSDLQAIDLSFDQINKSLIYPVTGTKEGISANTPVYKDQKEALYRHLDALYTRAAQEILNGYIALAPYKDEAYTLSLQAAYRVISGFDATEHAALYRQKTVSKKQVLDHIQDEIKQEERGED